LDIGPALDSIFVLSGAGLITNRDHFATSDSEGELLDRMRYFADPSISDETIRSRFELKDNSVWKLPKARKDFMRRQVSAAKIAPLAYRPFDKRLMYYDKAIVFNPRVETMTPMLTGNNIAIICTGQIDSETFNHVFVATCPVEKKLATHYGASVMFPLYRNRGAPGDLLGGSGLLLNLSPETQSAFLHGADDDESARGFLSYVYSILHSPAYRIRYSSGLRIYFPRVPVPRSRNLFRDLARVGSELVALHLIESPKLDSFVTTYTGPKKPEVVRVGWSDDTVWLDAAATKKGEPATPGTIGFCGVPEEVWNFHIGGYQVCEKWLKDRKGRTLSNEDIAHYQKVVVALNETLRLMKEIDEVIERHGGWPMAFQGADALKEAPEHVLKVAEPAPEYPSKEGEAKR
jgi:predicted helicase